MGPESRRLLVSRAAATSVLSQVEVQELAVATLPPQLVLRASTALVPGHGRKAV